MKAASVLALVFVGLCGHGLGRPGEKKFPTVSWVDCSEVEGGKEYFKCMELNMDSGVKIARLNKVDDLDDVLNGNIAGDDDSAVSVTIRDDMNEMMVADPNHGVLIFKHNPVSGESSDDGLHDDAVYHVDDEPLAYSDEELRLPSLE